MGMKFKTGLVCEECGSSLEWDAATEIYRCSNEGCGAEFTEEEIDCLDPGPGNS